MLVKFVACKKTQGLIAVFTGFCHYTVPFAWRGIDM